MKKVVTILGGLVYIGLLVACLGYVWYLYLYEGEGHFLDGTRCMQIHGYYFPYSLFVIASASLIPMIIVNFFRLLRYCPVANGIICAERELRILSEYSIFILLLSFLLILPQTDVISENTKKYFINVYSSKPPEYVVRRTHSKPGKVSTDIWLNNYEMALEKAKKENKPLIIMLTAEWCGYCRKLEKETLSEKSIKEMLSAFVCVKVYENKGANKKYDSRGYPTLVFAKPDGEMVYKTVGFMDPIAFGRELIRVYDKFGLELTRAFDKNFHAFELHDPQVTFEIKEDSEYDGDVSVHLKHKGKMIEPVEVNRQDRVGTVSFKYVTPGEYYLYFKGDGIASQWRRLNLTGKGVFDPPHVTVGFYKKRYAVVRYVINTKGGTTLDETSEACISGTGAYSHWTSLPVFGRDWQFWQRSKDNLFGKEPYIQFHNISKENGLIRTTKRFEDLQEVPDKLKFCCENIPAQPGEVLLFRMEAKDKVLLYGKMEILDVTLDPAPEIERH